MFVDFYFTPFLATKHNNNDGMRHETVRLDRTIDCSSIKTGRMVREAVAAVIIEKYRSNLNFLLVFFFASLLCSFFFFNSRERRIRESRWIVSIPRYARYNNSSSNSNDQCRRYDQCRRRSNNSSSRRSNNTTYMVWRGLPNMIDKRRIESIPRHGSRVV